MATGKKFYWIKLKSAFMTSDTVDFLMSQKDGSGNSNGANYVVLYQMLCLKTINTNGILARKIGEVIIPYDCDKIQRDCKYFSKDTIMVALNLYKRLGLIYEQEDGTLKISDFESLVGCETDYAERKRELRSRDNVSNVSRICLDECPKNVHTEIENRDRDIENRDRDIEKDIRDKDLENKDRDKSKDLGTGFKDSKSLNINNSCGHFQRPTIQQVQEYCNERNNSVDAERFVDYYESNGWKVGKNSMKDWKAAVRTWERNNIPKKTLAEQFLEG